MSSLAWVFAVGVALLLSIGAGAWQGYAAVGRVRASAAPLTPKEFTSAERNARTYIVIRWVVHGASAFGLTALRMLAAASPLQVAGNAGAAVSRHSMRSTPEWLLKQAPWTLAVASVLAFTVVMYLFTQTPQRRGKLKLKWWARAVLPFAEGALLEDSCEEQFGVIDSFRQAKLREREQKVYDEIARDARDVLRLVRHLPVREFRRMVTAQIQDLSWRTTGDLVADRVSTTPKRIEAHFRDLRADPDHQDYWYELVLRDMGRQLGSEALHLFVRHVSAQTVAGGPGAPAAAHPVIDIRRSADADDASALRSSTSPDP